MSYTCDIFSSSCSGSGGKSFPCSTASSSNRSRVSIALNINVKLCRPGYYVACEIKTTSMNIFRYWYHKRAFSKIAKQHGKYSLYVPTGDTR